MTDIDRKPPAPTTAPMPDAPPKIAAAIRVRELRFVGEHNVPLAANEGGMRIITSGERRRAGGTWIEIQFEPWQRHHRVREYDERGGKLRSEFCVPEAWALYVPEPV